MSYYVATDSSRHDIEPLTHEGQPPAEFLTDPEEPLGRSVTDLDREGTLVLFLYEAPETPEPRLCLVADRAGSGTAGDVELAFGQLPVAGTWESRHPDAVTLGDRVAETPKDSSLDESPFHQRVTLSWDGEHGNAVHHAGDLVDAFDVSVELLDETNVDRLVVASGDPEDPTIHELSLDDVVTVGSERPDAVTATVTTLSYIPGGNEDTTRGGDVLGSGVPQLFQDATFSFSVPPSVDLENPDAYDFLEVLSSGLSASLPVHPVFDNWAAGDQVSVDEGLPDLLGTPDHPDTARWKTRHKFEEIHRDSRMSNFKFRNELAVTFETDGESIDEETIRFHQNASATDSIYEQEDLNPLPRDWFDFREPVGATSYRMPASTTQPQHNYELTTVDGIDAVRTVVTAAGQNQFIPGVKNQLRENPISVLATVFDWPDSVHEVTKLFDIFEQQFQPVIDLFDISPKIFTCFELLALADGRKFVRLWDHSMFPHHQVYLGTGEARPEKQFESNLDVDRFEQWNHFWMMFFAEAAVGHTPYTGADYSRHLSNRTDETRPSEFLDDILGSSLFSTFHPDIPDPEEIVADLTHDHPVATFGLDENDAELDTEAVDAAFSAFDQQVLDPFDRDLLPRHEESWEAGELEGVRIRHSETWEAGPPPEFQRRHVEHWEAEALDDIRLQHAEQWESGALAGIDLRHVERWEPADAVAPAPPRNLTATAEGSTSVELDWDPPADDEIDVSSYVVTVDGVDDQTVAASETTTTIDGLEQGRTYTVGVRVVDAEENESDPVTIDVATGGDPYSIRIEPIEGTVYENGYVESDVVLEAAPAGLSSASVTVTVADESVATVDDAAPGPALEGSSSVSIDGATTATVDASDVEVDPGATDVELLTLTFATHATGDLDVGIEDAAGTTASGGTITTTTAGIDPAVEPVLPDSDYEPRDLNGDGLYRDINGDGSVSNGDVTDFFSRQHVSPWDDRPEFFDFTGDDDVSQADVIALFEHVNS